MKKKSLVIIVFFVLVFVFFAFRDSFAKIAYEKYRKPDVALFLVFKDSQLSMKIGNYYFNGGAYDPVKAAKAFEKVIDINSDFLWANYQLARVYFVMGNQEKALEAINNELRINKEDLRSLYVRGLIYGSLGKFSQAEDDFRRFTRWAPKEWAGYNDLGWTLVKQGKYKETIEVIEEAFKNTPNGSKNIWLQNTLGVAYLNLKEYKKAQTTFEKVSQLAENLTIEEWISAYPGNNPADAVDGLEAFRNAIHLNLKNSTFVDNSL